MRCLDAGRGLLWKYRAFFTKGFSVLDILQSDAAEHLHPAIRWELNKYLEPAQVAAALSDSEEGLALLFRYYAWSGIPLLGDDQLPDDRSKFAIGMLAHVSEHYTNFGDCRQAGEEIIKLCLDYLWYVLPNNDLPKGIGHILVYPPRLGDTPNPFVLKHRNTYAKKILEACKARNDTRSLLYCQQLFSKKPVQIPPTLTTAQLTY